MSRSPSHRSKPTGLAPRPSTHSRSRLPRRLGLLTAGLLALSGAAHAATVSGCGTLSVDTTWTADNVYKLDGCSLTVAAGATLTVQPGTVVKVGGNASAIIVSGQLEAVGSAAQPVAFTSLADDTRGGDTNENGSATTAAAGDWYGFLFQPGSSGRLEHFFVGYAASGKFSSATLTYSRAQIEVNSAVIALRDGEIAHGLRKGVYLQGTGITPVLQRLAIHHHVRESGYTSSSGIGYPVYQTTPNMQPSYADLSLSGNEHDVVMIYDFRELLTQDLVLGGAPFGVDCGYTLCQLKVAAGRTLTIQPGTRIDFSTPFGSNAPFAIAVEAGGSLIAEGTPSQPITLFSSRAAAGDGNSHYWYGLWAKADSRLRLAHCDIAHTSNSNFGNGAVEIDTSDAQVRHCRLHHGLGDGLHLLANSSKSVSLQLEDLQLHDNARHGLYVAAQSTGRTQAQLTRISIERNGHAGVRAYTSNSIVELGLTDSSVHDNGQIGTLGNQIQTAGLYFGESNISPALDNVSIQGNRGVAAYWKCDASITARDLTVSGNQRDRIVLPRCDIAGGRQWDLGEAGVGVDADDNVIVTGGAFLSILPGSELRFVPNRALSVSGSLFALGTATAPIRLLGQSPVPAGWDGVNVISNGSAFLSHCEIAHAGRLSSAGYAGIYLSPYAKTAVVQNCDLHHNTRGIASALEGAVIRNNSLRDNTAFGVSHGGYGKPPVDARGNWWGVASGPYHPVTNAAGGGNPVSDSVLYDPWLEAEPTDAGLIGDTVIVTTGSPDFVSPGQNIDYSVQYLNLRSEAVQNALMVMQLPVAAEFISATHGGVYWAARHQVIWRPGTVAPGALGHVSTELRLAWGLPRGYRDGTLTLFSGDNYRADTHTAEERAAYLALSPDALSDYATIAPAAYDVERSSTAALESLHQQALGEGFLFNHAAHIERIGGASATLGVYLHPQSRHSRLLVRQGARAAAIAISTDGVSLYDADGGLRIGLDTGELTEWGNWAPAEGGKASGCTYQSCKLKCRTETIGLAYLGRKVGRIAGWTALGLLSGGTTVIGAAVELGDLAWTGIDAIWKCDNDCWSNPNSHCCSDGQVKWTGGFAMQVLSMCFKNTCSAAGTWVPSGSRTCVTGTRCVAGIDGGGCTDCDESIKRSAADEALPGAEPAAAVADDCAAGSKAAGGAKPRCRDLELFVAKDPNDIRGPDGDVMPGQSVDYLIRYENEGMGRAYGVYIVNALPDELDENTLVIGGGGQLNRSSRELFWLIGELGPKGDPDSEGSVSYSAKVRTGLPSGTPIANQAVVYFPSVPETTPTNTWVNLVQPLAAIPQTVDTDYRVPLAITLAGREVSSLPLSYAIAQSPSRGTLSGAPPNLTYTPAAGTVGEDSFSFTVSNGTSTSRAAQVLIRIASTGDLDPPTVLSAAPTDGATGVEVSAVPLFEDSTGPVYAPVITIAVSEPLNVDTLTALRVVLEGPEGPVSASVHFDGAGQRIVLIPRQPLLGLTAYQLRLLAGITDVEGNPLAAQSFGFTTGDAPLPPVPLIFSNGFENPN